MENQLSSSRIFSKDLQKRNIEPEKFGDRIIFMSMFNDMNSQEKEMKRIAFQIQTKSRCT